MGKIFNPLKILKQIDRRVINLLSKKQLKLLLLLVASAAKNNGKGELKHETIENFAGVYFSGEDLFVVCQSLKRFGWGKLTCCEQKNPKIPPCLGENWKDLPIGISFRIDKRRKSKMIKHKRQMEKIMSKMKCPKDFACYKFDFKNFSKTKDVPMESFVECSSKDAWQCEYSLLFGSSYLCKCPLRVYVLKKLIKYAQ